MGVVVTVCGSVGGIGTSTLAFALALQAGPGTVLIDGQSDGVPLDVLIGAEASPGIRWSQVRIRTSDIAAETIRASLPDCHGLRVLSADRDAAADPTAVGHVVEVLRTEDGVVVIDVPSRSSLRQTLVPDVDALLLPPTLPGIVAARHVVLPTTRVAVVNTGSADVQSSRIGHYLDRDVVGTMRWQRAVSVAATSALPLPATTDVMRIAAEMLGGAVDGL